MAQKKNNAPNHKINRQIRSSEVRLVGDNLENSGDVVTIKDALRIADEMDEDLIEINENANPSVCRIEDYKKFLYDLKMKKREAEKKQKEKKQDIKELRFGPNTDEHDYNFKLKHAVSFLSRGDILKAFVFFKGREIQFKDKGEILLLKLANDLEDYGVPDTVTPKLEGKRMTIFIRPKKNKTKNG